MISIKSNEYYGKLAQGIGRRYVPGTREIFTLTDICAMKFGNGDVSVAGNVDTVRPANCRNCGAALKGDCEYCGTKYV